MFILLLGPILRVTLSTHVLPLLSISCILFSYYHQWVYLHD